MKGVARRQKLSVTATVSRQKFDLQTKKLRDELQKARKKAAASKKRMP